MNARLVFRNDSLAPVSYEFRVRLTPNAVGIDVWRNDRRIARDKYRWSPSRADRFAMAAHKCDPREAVNAFDYSIGDDYLTALFAESRLVHNVPRGMR